MNRRGMLKGLGAAAAAALWPGWLSEAFAGQPCGVLRGTATLGAALQRAHDTVKPLVMLVVPANDGEKWDRGRHFGEWLNFGSDADLAPLACAEVVCCEMPAVRQLFPSAPATTEPAVLVAQVDWAPARLNVALAAFESHADEPWDTLEPAPVVDGMTEDERRQLMAARYRKAHLLVEDGIQTCIDRTGAAIRKAILGDVAELDRRVDLLYESFGRKPLDLAWKIINGADGSPRDVVAAAPMLAKVALERGGSEEKRLTRLLAEAARAQYCTQRIPGSKWAHASGCGETIEGEDTLSMVMCGMGHVPRQSQRFLYFFTKPPFGQ